MDKDTVIIVGSGVSGLLTAWEAVKAGHKVTVVSKSSDPRKSPKADPFSSTFGGEDSRYVTIAEGHPYLGTAENYISAMYPDMQTAFTTSIFEGGWLSKNFNEFSPSAQTWLKRRFAANENTQAIRNLFQNYIQQNLACMDMWSDLIDRQFELSARAIDLNKGVMRIYGNRDLFITARDFHGDNNVLLEELSADELAKQHPAYDEACTNGHVAGAIIVKGMTFRVQALLRHVLRLLEIRGAKLMFDAEIDRLQRNEQGEVCGVADVQNRTLSARHYALHPGAYAARTLFAGTPAENALAAVAGGWIKMPMPNSMEFPLKIHDGQHFHQGKLKPVVDLNLNPVTDMYGKKWLLIGGGYVFAGMPPFELPDNARAMMLSEIHRVTEMYLGPAYRAAKKNGTLISSDRICIRSFTPDDAELDVVLPTDQGGVALLEGGGNTGSTTKAPWIAKRAMERVKGIEPS